MKRTGIRAAITAAIAALALASVASAHLVTFGWKDNGNGTVTLFGEHWHGDQTTAFSDNAGIGIYNNVPTFLYKTPWVGVINNETRATLLSNGTLTGFQTGFNGSSFDYADWFYTAPLVIGNGTWGFYTGANCCVDTMDNMAVVTLTGITSVASGTGPSSVPDSGSFALYGVALLGLGLVRRFKVA